MAKPVIVIHYHELWLKGRNRRFFLARLASALRHALDGLPLIALERPGDRLVAHFQDAGALQEALRRVRRVFGVAYCAIARPVDRDLDALCRAAWEEVEPLEFRSFAVRARRSDKSFAHGSMEIERTVGRYLLDQLHAAGRDVRVELDAPEITCRVEIPPGPALLYARKISGPGGLPTNSSGRMTCLLSGGFDSAVAAYRMMARGAHVSFVHFFGGGAQPGESSVHVARELVRCLVQYQYSAKLYCVALDPIQHEVVRAAPEKFRTLLYRRMMMRIAERLGRQERALALITGDSLGQVASQTLQNMVAVGDATRMPVFRPLAGTDKLEIMAQAREIGTHDTSAEPFHDCCPIFLPRNPALHATPRQLEAAESSLDVGTLVREAVRTASLERFRYLKGCVEEEALATKRAPANIAAQIA